MELIRTGCTPTRARVAPVTVPRRASAAPPAAERKVLIHRVIRIMLSRHVGCFFMMSLREANCIFVAKKYGLANHCAAALCGHYRGPHPRVAHRAAVCARLAHSRLPTSTTTTLSGIRHPAAAQE